MALSAGQWEKIKALFESAMEKAPQARAEFLEEVCPDEEIRKEVERLLAYGNEAGSFLSHMSLGAQAPLPSQAAPTLPPGEVLADRFRIARFIARGGMGEVYEAEDLELGERVAIKTILPEVLSEPRSRERFRREVQLAKCVTHANICRIYDLFRHWTHGPGPDGDEREIVFVSMELLVGETLAARLTRKDRMTTAEALPIVTQIASALDPAHGAGVLHRDLKPANVVLVLARDRAEVRAVVADFGLARRSASGRDVTLTPTKPEFLGTPAYMVS